MNANAHDKRVRVRSCGLLIEKGELLLVELFSPVTEQWTWLPPGGGVEFGEPLEDALVREFEEETGLLVSVGERVHVNEVISSRVHAIEFYYSVKRIGGEMKLGSDPEMSPDNQLLRNIGFFSKAEMKTMTTAPGFLDELGF